jgi:RHS repeat-associated protein
MVRFRHGAFLALGLAACAMQAVAQEVRYIHTDALGSVVAISDQQGNLVERFEYEPYGHVLNQAPRNGPAFVGHVMDAVTGLTYMQQRYYDPMCGCFPSVDPVTAFHSGDMRHFNRYAYAYNNPYRYSDPDGRSGLDWSARYRASLAMAGGNQATANAKMVEGLGIGLAVAGGVATGAPLAYELGWAALTNPKTAHAIVNGVADMAAGDALGGASLTVGAGATAVTAARIEAALAGSNMKTTQRAVSMPVVQRYVDALGGGNKAPAIRVADGVIVDGNHRYVAGRVAGQPPAVQPGTLSPGQAGQVQPIQEIRVDPVDWGNR